MRNMEIITKKDRQWDRLTIYGDIFYDYNPQIINFLIGKNIPATKILVISEKNGCTKEIVRKYIMLPNKIW